MTEKVLLKVGEACEALGLSQASLYREMQAGWLRYVIVGSRSRRIPADAIAEFVEALEPEQAARG